MKAVILVLLLCISATLASQCLGVAKPPTKKDSCGNYKCRNGYYCDKTAICSDRVAAGGACESSLNPCIFGATCKGPDNAKTCVLYANPGQDCSTSSSDTLPTCGPSLTCSFTDKKCVGGSYKDKCTDAKDCGSNVCTNGLCDAPALNSTCGFLGSNSCGPDMYCAGDFFNGYRCVPRLSVGAECPSQDSCPVKTVCIGKTPESIPVCTALKTVEVGGYCDENHELCASGICSTYCAEKIPDVCSDRFCGSTEICTCGSSVLLTGYGTCSPFKCSKAANALSDCLFTNCKVYIPAIELYAESNRFKYSNSCGSLNCLAAYNDFVSCADSQYYFDIQNISS